MFRIIFLSTCMLMAFHQGFAAGIKAYFSYAVFNSPGKGPYLETYLTISGNSVKFIREKGKFKGQVHIIMNFKKANELVKNSNYNLSSPEINDTLTPPNFIDQQRFSLPNGEYDFEITIEDSHDLQHSRFTSIEKIKIDIPTQQIVVSDIQLIESFTKSVKPSIITKSGYDLIPYSLNYYPDEMTSLSFYSETYNTNAVLGKDARFAFVYYVESYETLEKMEGLYAFSKQTSAPVNVLMNQLNIKKLPTGNYNLVIEVRDQKNLIQAQKKVFFQRRNNEAQIQLSDLASIDPNATFASKYKNKDSLKDILRSLWPVSSPMEREWQNNQITTTDLKSMQQYLYVFWKNRNQRNPEEEWNKYHEKVELVDKLFRAGKTPGYATDRGRVYLQYGPPDSRQEVPSEPESYPYEIWQYYRIVDPVNAQMQTNKRFVFYNREIAGNNFELLHSDARGELKDSRWQFRLRQRTQQKLNLDVEKPNENYGSRADELFNNPR